MSPVQAAFRLLPPCPRPGVVVDLCYYAARDDVPEYWTLRLYRDNINKTLTGGEDAVAVFNWLNDALQILRRIERHVYPEIYEVAPRRSQ